MSAGRTDYGGGDRQARGANGTNIFLYFADKREVLFAGAGSLQDFLVGALASAPDSAAPINAVASALEAAGALLQERREYARQRQSVIAANAELQERELIKLASLASAIAGVLRRRGVADSAASLTAEAGIAVFRIAFERWVSQTSRQDLPHFIRESLDELKAVTAATHPRPRNRRCRTPCAGSYPGRERCPDCGADPAQVGEG